MNESLQVTTRVPSLKVFTDSVPNVGPSTETRPRVEGVVTLVLLLLDDLVVVPYRGALRLLVAPGTYGYDDPVQSQTRNDTPKFVPSVTGEKGRPP